MRDHEFDQIMDSWVEEESASAPTLRPTAEMVRLVIARREQQAGPRREQQAGPRRRQPPRLWASRSWRPVAAAAASLAVLAILFVVLFPPTPSPIQQLALLEQREVVASEKGWVVTEPEGPPRGDKGDKGKGEPVFGRLILHIHRPDSSVVQAIDMQRPQEELLVLTPADDYRLLLEPGKDWHVAIFQLTASGALVQLFPNDVYGAATNPIPAGQQVYLPAEPNWLFLDQHAGEERLTVIACPQPLPELDGLYDQYTQALGSPTEQDRLEEMLAMLDTIDQALSGTVSKWVFDFQHR